MIGKDKILHFICCLLITILFGFLINLTVGIIVALIVALGKEAYDEIRPNGTGWSWDDILVDLLGIVLGALIL